MGDKNFEELEFTMLRDGLAAQEKAIASLLTIGLVQRNT
jgi:hypothetical protein